MAIGGTMSSEPAREVEQLLEGTPYRLLRRLAAGGMGEIYEAIARDGSEKIVVKLLRADLLNQADIVLVTRPDAAPARVKLLDFGVAKVTSGPDQLIEPLAFPTMDGQCVGTPRYASPEQARGAAVDERSDIYAAGILLYTLVAGRGPFDEIRGASNVLLAHISEEPPPPSRFTRVPIPAALEAVILRAIAKDPADRFADALSFSRELLVTMGK